MDVYFDKSNLASFLSSCTHDMFSDCMRMLQKKCTIRLNFTKEDLIDFPTCTEVEREQNRIIKMWLTQLSDAKWQSVVKKEDFGGFDCTSFYDNLDQTQLSSIYLLDNPQVKGLINDGCLLVASVGGEVDALSSLILNDDYGFVKPIAIREMLGWSDTTDYLSPCTDIILVDRYVFFAEDEVLRKNLFPLVALLAQHAKYKRVNICIVTDKKDGKWEPNWEDLERKIKQSVKSKTKSEPNVTFVLMTRDLPSGIREHDRTIYTNYKYLSSGDSWNYFGERRADADHSQSIISAGRLLSLFSFADKDNYHVGQVFIDDIQTLINEVKKVSPYFIKGDKKSNFLKF